MASLTKRRAKGFGSVEAKGHTDKTTDTREVGPKRETDGTSVTALAGMVISENYNSIKVEVGITVPTIYAKRKKALKEAWEFIDEEMADKMSDAKQLLSEL